MFEIVPPDPEPLEPLTFLPTAKDILSFKMPSLDDLADEVWNSMQDAIAPLILPFAVIGGSAIVFMFVVKKMLAGRAHKHMGDVAEPTTPKGLRWFLGSGSRIDDRMELSGKGIWATIRRPRTHAACWYIAGGSKEKFESLLAVSKDGERFGEHLPPIAKKLEKTWEGDPVEGWSRVMMFADRPDAHELLATPGYSMLASLVAVEQNMPLEYAEALV